MKKLGHLFLSIVPLIASLLLQIFAMILLMILSTVFMLIISPLLFGTQYSITDLSNLWMNQDFNTVIYIVYAIYAIIVFGLWYKKRCNGNFSPDIKSTFHPLEFLGIAFLVPGTQYLCTIIVSIVSVIFPSWLAAYEELLDSAGLSEEISLLMMLYSVILAPICEELIFRGVSLQILKRSFPFWFANIFQALLFGCFHMNLLQGVYTFFVGLFMGYVFEKGGSIYHVIFFHFLFNLWGTTASKLLLVENAALQGLIIILGLVGGLTIGLKLLNKGALAKQIKEGV